MLDALTADEQRLVSEMRQAVRSDGLVKRAARLVGRILDLRRRSQRTKVLRRLEQLGILVKHGRGYRMVQDESQRSSAGIISLPEYYRQGLSFDGLRSSVQKVRRVVDHLGDRIAAREQVLRDEIAQAEAVKAEYQRLHDSLVAQLAAAEAQLVNLTGESGDNRSANSDAVEPSGNRRRRVQAARSRRGTQAHHGSRQRLDWPTILKAVETQLENGQPTCSVVAGQLGVSVGTVLRARQRLSQEVNKVDRSSGRQRKKARKA